MRSKSSQHCLFWGIAYFFPLVVWSLGQGVEPYSGLFPAGALAVRTLVFLQAAVITLWIPWHSNDGTWFNVLLDALCLMLIPLPFVTFLWLTGAVKLMAFARAEIAVMALAVVLLVGVRNLRRFLQEVSSQTLVQVAGVAGLWAFRDDWLVWLGL